MYKVVRLLSLGILALFSILAIAFAIIRYINRSELEDMGITNLGMSMLYGVVGIVTLVYTIILVRQTLLKSDEELDDSGLLDDDILRD